MFYFVKQIKRSFSYIIKIFLENAEDGFKSHLLNGKKWDYDSNLKEEIKQFSRDGEIDIEEEAILKKILKYNEEKHREKLVLQNITRKELEILRRITGLNIEIKNKIDAILGVTEVKTEQVRGLTKQNEPVLGLEDLQLGGGKNNGDSDNQNKIPTQETEIFGNLDIPERWKKVFIEFLSKAKSSKERNEILCGRYPIALTTVKPAKGVILLGKNKPIDFSVSYSRNRKFVEGATEGDNAVNFGFIETFLYARPYKHGGMAIIVKEQVENGSWKWWHAKENGKFTIGCKGLPPQIAYTLASYVNTKGGGFGYTSIG